MNDTLQRIPSAHVIIRSSTPTKRQLVEDILDQLTVMAATIASVTDERCAATCPLTDEEATELLSRIFADGAAMTSSEGRSHDAIQAYRLARTVSEPGVRYLVTPTGALLRYGKGRSGGRLSTIDPAVDLPRLSTATLVQMRSDLDHSVEFVRQELQIAT